jgi:antitoxin PrlF
MALVFERDSTITRKGQTTIPKPVREALGVGAGDRIRFRVDSERRVTVHRAEEEDDPVIDAFLAFLATDIQRKPDVLAALSPAFVQKIADLTKGVELDVDEPIEGEVDL